MKTIPLTRGFSAIVDDQDFEFLIRFRWQALLGNTGKVYAVRTLPRKGGCQKKTRMHNDIMGCLNIDHIDGDPLNNCRSNLRVATEWQNSAYKRKPKGNFSSRFKGVTWNFKSLKWQAGIQHFRRSYHLGLFHSEHDAAMAYDRFAKHLFGEFALLNFPTTAMDNRYIVP
jgi:hypothetical protein